MYGTGGRAPRQRPARTQRTRQRALRRRLPPRCARARTGVFVRVPVLLQPRLAAAQQPLNGRRVGLRCASKGNQGQRLKCNEQSCALRAPRGATHHAAVLLELVAHAAELRPRRARVRRGARVQPRLAGERSESACSGGRGAARRGRRTHLLIEQRAVDTPVEHRAQAVPAERASGGVRVTAARHAAQQAPPLGPRACTGGWPAAAAQPPART